MKKFKTALVVGTGAFGTSAAAVVSNNFEKVILKVRPEEPKLYDCLLKGENSFYLPGHQLPKNIVPALTWDEVKELTEGKVELVISGLPTGAIKVFCKENFNEFKYYLDAGIPVVSLSKGIDTETFELPDDLFFHHFADYKDQFVFLSGPSFATEILQEQITCVSIASRSQQMMAQVMEMMATDYFKLFQTYDVKGVLLGGALKNVLAIAAGVLEGVGYNHNTRAAMITRGIVEMLRFGKVFNARPETFYGLSGMGDLILTTTSDLSRNKTFGKEIATGKTSKEIFKTYKSLVEGYATSKAVYHLARKYNIRCLIFDSIYHVLHDEMPPREAIAKLMQAKSTYQEL